MHIQLMEIENVAQKEIANLANKVQRKFIAVDWKKIIIRAEFFQERLRLTFSIRGSSPRNSESLSVEIQNPSS